MATFIFGLFVGTLFGMIIMSMCVVAKQSDHKSIVNTHAESVEESSPEK